MRTLAFPFLSCYAKLCGKMTSFQLIALSYTSLDRRYESLGSVTKLNNHTELICDERSVMRSWNFNVFYKYNKQQNVIRYHRTS